ncbi:MAG: hypothetical protein JWO70_3596 [Betaproteobacteria bacterium]|nr:hypothetical protein [Betaproteobacteria bacterium]
MELHLRSSSLRAGGIRLSIIAAALFTVGGCAHVSAQPHASGDSYERSTLRLSRPPEQAAACLVEHAQSAGQAAEIVPLYGLESVAVTVKASATGDVLAVLSLVRADAGARAAVTTLKGALTNRVDFLSRLVQGC